MNDMGVDILDGVNMNMRIRTSTDNGDGEASEGGEVTPTKVYVVRDEVLVVEPHVGMEFETESSAKAFYDDYARREGFRTRTFQMGRFGPDSPVTRQFICTKEGTKRRSYNMCGAMMRIELKGNKWVVTEFVKEHHHVSENSKKVRSLRPHKNFSEEYQAGIMVPSGVMYVNTDENKKSLEANRVARSMSPVESGRQIKGSNCVNSAIRPVASKRTWGKYAQDMLDYFTKMQAMNPGFFYAIQLDEDNRMANAFWADARSRTAYAHFGDVVTLDTSYRVNQYKVPFAPFTGVNHHGQTILFGCALLLDDSEASFVWLLRTFLTAMNDHSPVSIVTVQDKTIQVAVNHVLPKARHCISKWHVLREGQERLAHVCLTNPNFQVELYNCINLTETIEHFESSWDLILDKYDLRKNDWLQSIYNTRKQWVPAYFRDSFFAAISPNQGVECSFFDGFVNQQTTVPFFFQQYERAMEYWFEKEIEADFDTISNTPVLSTPSPMEKQAADLYTKKIFTKFQDELVETFAYTATRIDGDGATSTYRVAKFEDDHKSYTVTLNISDMRASCSCLMFEYSGILCRHVLTVFTVTNVLTLPSHFILKRWTRNAKFVVPLDDPSVDDAQDSITSRYNSFCREAIRYAEEGATTSDTYITALTGLIDMGRKIANVKKNVMKVAPKTVSVVTSGYDDKKTSSDTPLLWPKQDEVTKRFNLNDSAIHHRPVSDMNLIRMAPVSIQRDDTSCGNTVCKRILLWSLTSLYINVGVQLTDHIFVSRLYFLVLSQ